MTKLSESIAKIKNATAMGMERALVFCSAGKESVALVDVFAKSGVDFEIVHKYFTKDLSFNEDVLRSIEDRYGKKIIRVASPERVDMYRNDVLRIKLLFNETRIKKVCLRKFDRDLKQKTGCDWTAFGCRKSDSPLRALILNKYPNPNQNKAVVYPLADWRKQDVWDYIEKERLAKNKVYAHIKRSIHCVNVKNCEIIRKNFAEDYKKVTDDFPLIECLLWLKSKRESEGEKVTNRVGDV